MFNLLQASTQSPGGGYGTLIMLGVIILVLAVVVQFLKNLKSR